MERQDEIVHFRSGVEAFHHTPRRRHQSRLRVMPPGSPLVRCEQTIFPHICILTTQKRGRARLAHALLSAAPSPFVPLLANAHSAEVEVISKRGNAQVQLVAGNTDPTDSQNY